MVLSLSADWQFHLLLLSDAISQGCSGLGLAWPVQLRAPSHVSYLPSSQTGHLSTVYVNMTSQAPHWQVDESRFLGSAPASCYWCHLFSALASTAFGGSDASCCFKKCLRTPNLCCTNFFISNNYPNIPLTYHFNYIPFSLSHLNAFVNVLILGFFSLLVFNPTFHLLSVTLSPFWCLEYFRSLQNFPLISVLEQLHIAATTFKMLLSGFQLDQLLLG